jgi:hypothetical protein
MVQKKISAPSPAPGECPLRRGETYCMSRSMNVPREEHPHVTDEGEAASKVLTKELVLRSTTKYVLPIEIKI